MMQGFAGRVREHLRHAVATADRDAALAAACLRVIILVASVRRAQATPASWVGRRCWSIGVRTISQRSCRSWPSRRHPLDGTSSSAQPAVEA
jgi:hypothetical protein